MKKFLFSILGFILLSCGVFISACGKSEISISLSETSVNIYTNDSSEDNYKTATITVDVSGTDSGITASVSGAYENVLSAPVVTKLSKKKYEVQISSVDEAALTATGAEVSIKTLEGNCEEKVKVFVYAKVLSMTKKNETLTDNKTNFFFVRGEEKTLESDTYIDFNPSYSNLKDITWTLYDDSVTGVTITDNRVYVSEDFDGNTVKLMATSNYNENVKTEDGITFDVIDKFEIDNFIVEDGRDVADTTSSNPVMLARNQGQTTSNLNLTVSANFDLDEISKKIYLSNTNTEVSEGEYVFVSVSNPEEEGIQKDYQITLDANGASNVGEVMIDFYIGYKNYNYYKTVRCYVSTNDVVDSLNVSNLTGTKYQENDFVDIYSSYVNATGEGFVVALFPTTVPVKNANYNIIIDPISSNLDLEHHELEDYLTFYNSRGLQIYFRRYGESQFITTSPIDNNSIIYAKAGEYATLNEGIEVQFVSTQTITAKCSLFFNLYSVGEGDYLPIDPAESYITEDMNDPDDFTYLQDLDTSDGYYNISLSAIETEVKTVVLKITGSISSSGLELSYNKQNSNFEVSELFEISNNELDGIDYESYVIVGFTVKLATTDIEDSLEISVIHKNGSKIEFPFLVKSFFPINEGVYLGYEDSVNVADKKTNTQGYAYLVEDGKELNIENETLSSLVVTNSSSIVLTVNTRATISSIEYYYLIKNDTVDYTKSWDEITIDDSVSFLKEYLEGNNDWFSNNENNLFFTIKSGNILECYNNSCQSYIVAVISAYDENHNEVKIYRSFYYEVYIPLNRLSSNRTEATIYTTESLSTLDLDKASIDVSIKLRNDSNNISYYDLVENFSFESTRVEYVYPEGSQYYNYSHGFVVSDNGTTLKNDYYLISNVRTTPNYLTFTITALSLNGLQSFDDILIISYNHFNVSISTEIKLYLLNADRVESVVWENSSLNNSLYFDVRESNTRIPLSISVSPSNAYNTQLRYYYSALEGSNNDLSINENTGVVSLNSTTGGYGYLYILPYDMIKSVQATSQVLCYDDNGLASYFPLSQIDSNYTKLINSTFKNNYNQVINVKDVVIRIYVRIADGTSKDKAFQVYSEKELREIEPENHYEVMNNISISNWSSISYLAGGIYGTNSNITLTFEAGALNNYNSTFINQLYGYVEDLTFNGEVVAEDAEDYAGFVVNQNYGLIKNVKIDVYSKVNTDFTTTTVASILKSDASNIGGIAGVNYGEIDSVSVLGLTIDKITGNTTTYVGGVAGYNTIVDTNQGVIVDDTTITRGQISNSVIHFYTFKDGYNYFSGTYVGSMVGYVNKGKILSSYAYAYPMAEVLEIKDSIDLTENTEEDNQPKEYEINVLKGTNVGAFAGYFELATSDDNDPNFDALNGFDIVESFAVVNVANSVSNTEVHIDNGYISYFEVVNNLEGKKELRYSSDIYYKGTIVGRDNVSRYRKVRFEYNKNFELRIPNKGQNDIVEDYFYYDLINGIYSDIKQIGNLFNLNYSLWMIENISEDFNSSVNNGLAYLRNIQQDAVVTANVLAESFNTFVDTDNSLGVSNGYGILYYKGVNENISESDIVADLKNRNTITFSELFGINGQLQNSIYVTSSNSTIVGINSNSLTTLTSTNFTITLTIGSKQNYNLKPATIEVLVINYIASFDASLNNSKIEDNENINIQIGNDYTKTIVFSIPSKISLGNKLSTFNLKENSYNLSYKFNDNDVLSDTNENYNLTPNGMSIITEAINYSENPVNLKVYLGISRKNNDVFEKAINDKFIRTFNLVSYLGANDMTISAVNLSIKPSTVATTTVSLFTDNVEDSITPIASIDANILERSKLSNKSNAFTFTNGEIGFDLSWIEEIIEIKAEDDTDNTNAKLVKSYIKNYHIMISISDEYKALIDSTKNIEFMFVAESKNELSVIANLTVTKQEIENIDISNKVVSNQSTINGRTYYTTWSSNSSTVSPGGYSILTLEISPEYSYYDYFEITYQTTSGKNVSIVAVDYNVNYGYYVVSTNSTSLSNGLRYTPDSVNGTYNFRVFVPTSFNISETVKLTFKFVNSITDTFEEVYYYLNVNYQNEAEILVNGETSTMVAKGRTAQITVTMEYDQEATISLKNVLSGIDIYNLEVNADKDKNIRVYTATLGVSLIPVLTSGKKSGVIYIDASVSRVINGVTETKTSRATVYIVDFNVDAENIRVKNSTQTTNYMGKQYDVFTGYIGLDEYLDFSIPLDPSSYYSTDIDEIDEIKELTKKRNNFLKYYYYEDADAQFYINYKYDEDRKLYTQPLEIKQQVRYVEDDGVTSHAIYNDETGVFNTNKYFSINDIDNPDLGGLVITGNLTGDQLMMLRTIIYVNGQKFIYDYYFVIKITIWTDEDTPLPIFTAEEFMSIKDNVDSGDYILMNDIVLDNYEPFSTEKINSFDGNNYTIHINSFNTSNITGETLQLALFNEVSNNTTLKNMTINVYNAYQLNIDISKIKTVEIAGLAISNSGIITNCQVVSYYDSNYNSKHLTGATGIVLKYINGENTSSAVVLNANSGITTNVAGLVVRNNSNGSITNSRVGGVSISRIGSSASAVAKGIYYIENQSLETFNIVAQGTVAGFVVDNSGKIAGSFVDSVQIDNDFNSTSSKTAGFVITNGNSIQTSYVEGVLSDDDIEGNIDGPSASITGSTISAVGEVAGFVHTNNSLIKNSYSNIKIENDNSQSRLSAGFVYINGVAGECYLCYSASTITASDITAMSFSGIDAYGVDLNAGEISLSYYYPTDGTASSIQGEYNTGAVEVSVTGDEAKTKLYGFSFSTDKFGEDGIWTIEDNRITLVSANVIALSNRYIVYNRDDTYSLPYSTLVDKSSGEKMDTSYGSAKNPIIIRSAQEFAEVVGDSNSSSIQNYYNDEYVFGNYRFVNDTDFNELAQNAEGNVEIKSTSKTFGSRLVNGSTTVGLGKIDGNGFKISNISLGSYDSMDSYGLFATLNNAIIINLDLSVSSVRNARAKIVGSLAGLAVNTDLIAINIEANDLDKITVQGNNLVGSLVGALFGDSRIDDVTVNNVYVWSDYINNNKTGYENDSYSNRNNVGFNLRRTVTSSTLFFNKVSNISYAGGVVGYVDIYSDLYNQSSEEFFNYETAVDNLSVNKVRVLESINVLGEVAGGLFGYIGHNTYMRDASLEITAYSQSDNARESYITAKNLYAGGIVGESYGVIESVYAKYDDDLQDLIEQNIHSYYNGNSSVERGKENIFDYSSVFTTENYSALYIGGIIGYAGSGYLSVAYNKLNVISSTGSIVGGIIGKIATNGYLGTGDKTENTTAFAVTESNDNAESFSIFNINYMLEEVYASGDVRSTLDSYKGSDRNKVYGAGGIIGSFVSEDGVGVYLKKVNSVNYFTIDSTGTPKTYEKTYAIIAELNERSTYLYFKSTEGHIYNTNYVWEKVEQNADKSLTVPVVGGSKVDVDSISTVGMNKHIKYNGVDIPVQIASNADVTYTDGVYKVVMNSFDENGVKTKVNKTDIVGLDDIVTASEIPSIKEGYTEIYNSFLGNKDWSSDNWEHLETLYPEMLVGANNNVIYLDCWNITSVLNSIKKNPNLIVIVRGEEEQNTGRYKDVDLSNYTEAISGFSGTFMGSDGAGSSKVFENSNGEVVGIKLAGPLFKTVGTNVTIRDLRIEYDDVNLNIYPSMLVESNIVNGTLKNLTLNFNMSSITLSGNNLGLIAPIIESTSLNNIVINLGNGSDETARNTDSYFLNANLKGDVGSTYSVGLIAGTLRQASAYVVLNVANLRINNNDKNKNSNILKVQFANDINSTVYAGTIFGKTEKGNPVEGTPAKMKFDSSNIYLDDMKIFIDGSDFNVESMYVGGIIGNAANINNFEIDLDSDHYNAERQLTSIIEFSDPHITKELNAGMLFGGLSEDFKIYSKSGDSTKLASVSGEIYTTNATSDSLLGVVNIGGLVGRANASLDVNITTVNFSLYNKNIDNKIEDFDKFINDIDLNFDDENGKVDKKLKEEKDSYLLQVNGGSNIGGLVGNMSSSGNIYVDYINTSTKNGLIAVMSLNESSINVGGAFGYVSNSVTLSQEKSNGDNSATGMVNIYTNMFIRKELSTSGDYIGGAAGLINGSATLKNVQYNGIVKLENLLIVYFGGIVGCVESGANITGCTYAGELDIHKNSVNENENSNTTNNYGLTSLTFGGIAGEVNGGSVSGNFSYGDLFVIYNDQEFTYINDFVFGGIVGRIKNSTTISNNISLTTNHSYREGKTKHVSFAIVGEYESTDSYSKVVNNNYYSSSVCLAYDDYGMDALYGSNQSDENKGGGYGQRAKEKNIFEIDSHPISIAGASKGTKLNPSRLFSDSTNAVSASLTSEEKPVSSTHHIIWYYIGDDWTYEQPEGTSTIDDNGNVVVTPAACDYVIEADALKKYEKTNKNGTKDLVNEIGFSIAGNGYTMTYGDNDNTEESTKYGSVKSFMDNIPKYSSVSSLKIDLDINYSEQSKQNAGDDDPRFGGFVETIGTHIGEAASGGVGGGILYAVGSTGTLSVGGETTITLGGLVGDMYGGYVTECYSSAEVIYRAKSGSSAAASGLINLYLQGVRHGYISNSYSTGTVRSYVGEINLYSFVGGSVSSSPDTQSELYIRNSYTISKLVDDDYLNEEKKGATEKDAISRGIINGNADIKKFYYDNSAVVQNSTSTKLNIKIEAKETNNMSLDYNNGFNYSTIIDGLKGVKVEAGSGGNAGDHLSNKSMIFYSNGLESGWAMSRLYNYGYAYRNFSHLIDVTTFTLESDEFVTANISMKSTDVINDFKAEYYLGVNNNGKLNALMSGADSENKLNYVLVEDLKDSMAVAVKSKIEIKSNLKFITFDGAGNTIQGLKNNSLFTGTVEDSVINNLRIVDFESSSTAALVKNVTDSVIKNITVNGDISNATSIVGGVINIATDVSLENINSVVSINSSKSTTGGIVGQLDINSVNNEIIYNTFSGTIFVSGDNSGGSLIAGGLIGQLNVNSGKEISITKSYNAASVLVDYGNSDNSASEMISGGLVGKIQSAGLVEISNCYNTGLIKSGNTLAQKSYAGGIFGYTTGTKTGNITSNITADNLKVENCTNDGSVEALAANNGGYSIKYKKLEQSAGKITIVVTYNDKNETRNVFAYGIGYNEENITYRNCYITDSCEIKNNGNIGKQSVENTFTFQHKTGSGGVNYRYYIPTMNLSGGRDSNLIVTSTDEYGMPTGIIMNAYILRIDTNVELSINKTKTGTWNHKEVIKNLINAKDSEFKDLYKNDSRIYEYGLTKVYEAWNLKYGYANDNANIGKESNPAITNIYGNCDYKSLLTYTGLQPDREDNFDIDHNTLNSSLVTDLKLLGDSNNENDIISQLTDEIAQKRESETASSYVKIAGDVGITIHNHNQFSLIATGGYYMTVKFNYKVDISEIRGKLKASNFTVTYDDANLVHTKFSHSNVELSTKEEDSYDEGVVLQATLFFTKPFGSGESFNANNLNVSCCYSTLASIKLTEDNVVKVKKGSDNDSDDLIRIKHSIGGEIELDLSTESYNLSGSNEDYYKVGAKLGGIDVDLYSVENGNGYLYYNGSTSSIPINVNSWIGKNLEINVFKKLDKELIPVIEVNLFENLDSGYESGPTYSVPSVTVKGSIELEFSSGKKFESLASNLNNDLLDRSSEKYPDDSTLYTYTLSIDKLKNRVSKSFDRLIISQINGFGNDSPICSVKIVSGYFDVNSIQYHSDFIRSTITSENLILRSEMNQLNFNIYVGYTNTSVKATDNIAINETSFSTDWSNTYKFNISGKLSGGSLSGDINLLDKDNKGFTLEGYDITLADKDPNYIPEYTIDENKIIWFGSGNNRVEILPYDDIITFEDDFVCQYNEIKDLKIESNSNVSTTRYYTIKVNDEDLGTYKVGIGQSLNILSSHKLSNVRQDGRTIINVSYHRDTATLNSNVIKELKNFTYKMEESSTEFKKLDLLNTNLVNISKIEANVYDSEDNYLISVSYEVFIDTEAPKQGTEPSREEIESGNYEKEEVTYYFYKIFNKDSGQSVYYTYSNEHGIKYYAIEPTGDGAELKQKDFEMTKDEVFKTGKKFEQSEEPIVPLGENNDIIYIISSSYLNEGQSGGEDNIKLFFGDKWDSSYKIEFKFELEAKLEGTFKYGNISNNDSNKVNEIYGNMFEVTLSNEMMGILGGKNNTTYVMTQTVKNHGENGDNYYINIGYDRSNTLSFENIAEQLTADIKAIYDMNLKTGYIDVLEYAPNNNTLINAHDNRDIEIMILKNDLDFGYSNPNIKMTKSLNMVGNNYILSFAEDNASLFRNSDENNGKMWYRDLKIVVQSSNSYGNYTGGFGVIGYTLNYLYFNNISIYGNMRNVSNLCGRVTDENTIYVLVQSLHNKDGNFENKQIISYLTVNSLTKSTAGKLGARAKSITTMLDGVSISMGTHANSIYNKGVLIAGNGMDAPDGVNGNSNNFYNGNTLSSHSKNAGFAGKGGTVSTETGKVFNGRSGNGGNGGTGEFGYAAWNISSSSKPTPGKGGGYGTEAASDNSDSNCVLKAVNGIGGAGGVGGFGTCYNGGASSSMLKNSANYAAGGGGAGGTAPYQEDKKLNDGTAYKGDDGTPGVSGADYRTSSNFYVWFMFPGYGLAYKKSEKVDVTSKNGTGGPAGEGSTGSYSSGTRISSIIEEYNNPDIVKLNVWGTWYYLGWKIDFAVSDKADRVRNIAYDGNYIGYGVNAGGEYGFNASASTSSAFVETSNKVNANTPRMFTQLSAIA